MLRRLIYISWCISNDLILYLEQCPEYRFWVTDCHFLNSSAFGACSVSFWWNWTAKPVRQILKSFKFRQIKVIYNKMFQHCIHRLQTNWWCGCGFGRVKKCCADDREDNIWWSADHMYHPHHIINFDMYYPYHPCHKYHHSLSSDYIYQHCIHRFQTNWCCGCAVAG